MIKYNNYINQRTYNRACFVLVNNQAVGLSAWCHTHRVQKYYKRLRMYYLENNIKTLDQEELNNLIAMLYLDNQNINKSLESKTMYQADEVNEILFEITLKQEQIKQKLEKIEDIVNLWDLDSNENTSYMCMNEIKKLF